MDLGTLENVSIKIYDVQGKLVFNVENINTESYQFNLDAKDGIYFMDVIGNENRYQLKLVKG